AELPGVLALQELHIARDHAERLLEVVRGDVRELLQLAVRAFELGLLLHEGGPPFHEERRRVIERDAGLSDLVAPGGRIEKRLLALEPSRVVAYPVDATHDAVREEQDGDESSEKPDEGSEDDAE